GGGEREHVPAGGERDEPVLERRVHDRLRLDIKLVADEQAAAAGLRDVRQAGGEQLLAQRAPRREEFVRQLGADGGRRRARDGVAAEGRAVVADRERARRLL